MFDLNKMYVQFSDMSMGTKPYGAYVHKQVELLPGVMYALIESRAFKSYPRPKCVTSYSLARFEYVQDEYGSYWNETSSYECSGKADALRKFKVCTSKP